MTPAGSTGPLAPFPHGTDTRGDQATRDMFASQWPQTAVPVLGLPAIVVPAGVVDGIPVCVQLIGPRHSDETLLDVAQRIEDRAGTFTPISPWGRRETT